MRQFKEWHKATLAAKTVEALQKNHFQAEYVPTRQEALEKVLALVPATATIGIGGSWTINELGIDEILEKRGHTIYNHNRPGLSPEVTLELRHKQLACDVFFTSTNALTLDGKLVNVDGAGNRVAAMMFGPKRVVIIAGVNKIVRDVAEAESRIKLFAAPPNNKRLNMPNPCVQTGRCMDCQSPTRICNITTIINKRPLATDVHIIIVGEELGY